MTKLLPKDLVYASELIDQARFKEAIEITEDFEKSKSLSLEDQLSTLLTKSRIYRYTREFEKNVEVSSNAFEISQDLGLVTESIEALIGKASIAFIGGLDKGASYILDAERRLNSLADDPSTGMLRRNLLFDRSWVLFFKANLNEAAESAQECLKLSKEQGNKLDIAATSFVLGYINLFQGNRNKALDYAMKSLEYNRELNHAAAIADCNILIANIYSFEGDLNKALQYCKQSLSIKEISKRGKLDLSENLAEIYRRQSELKRSLKYRQQAIVLAKELNITNRLVSNLFMMGYTYLVKQDIEQAVEYLERSRNLSEKWELFFQMAQSLCFLIFAYSRDEPREIANRYFSQLSDLFDQTKDKGEVDISLWFLQAKALMMKTSKRLRDRMEAQALYKELIDRLGEDPNLSDGLIYSIGSLCDLLLEELSTNNDPEILNEILPLITKSLEMAETARNFWWLANTKLLQGKLALLQMNFKEAKKFLTQAQHVAELHGLHLHAQMISEEHDKLITQLDEWDNLKKTNAPMSELIKMASTNDVLEHIQGTRAVVPTELVDEQSTVLLILAEGGALVFSYPFSNEWKIDEDLFSSFLSAFSSFSTEFFSKELDRVKFGDEMMLMESIGSLSFCYLFKGQTYVAKQKLSKFIEEVQKNKSLWQNLEDHYETSQVLELRESPQLESLITETFTSKS